MFLQKVKAVLVFLLNLIKRSLCCLRRRRKSSADISPLTDIGVVPNFHHHAGSQGDEMVNWNNWEDPSKPRAPQTVEEHIQYYRNQKMGKSNELPPEEPPVDFFQDMEPAIRKQTKVLMKPKESATAQLNRLAFNPNSETAIPDDSGELKSWEEAENREGDWGQQDEWNTDEMLRSKRKEEARRKAGEREHQRRGTVT